MAGTTTEDIASLVVNISANLTQYTKELEKVAGVTATAMKAAEKFVVTSNDNQQKSYKKTADEAAKTAKAAEKVGPAVAKGADQAQRSLKAARAESANMAAQFQDIAVQLQSGTSPMTIAFQQGTQLASVLQGIKAQGGGLGSSLVAAVGSFINPIQIATIAAIALGGALIKSFSGGGKAAEEAIAKIDKTIAKLKDIQKIAEDTGATGLAMKVSVELDEAQVQQIKMKLQAMLDEMVAGTTSGPRKDWVDKFFAFADGLDAMADSAAKWTHGWIATMAGMDVTKVDELGSAIDKLAPATMNTAQAAEQIKDIGDAFDRLTSALTNRQAEDAMAAWDTLTKLPTTALFGPTVDEFNQKMGAALPKVLELVDGIRTIKPAFDNANQATDAAQKKLKDYNKAMDDLAGFSSTLTKQEQEILKIKDAWLAAVNSATSYQQQQAAGFALQSGLDKMKLDALDEQNKLTAELLVKQEGFRENAYLDQGRIRKFRVGFGSDTMTDAFGNVTEVTEKSVTTIEDSYRDLFRRIRTEFQPMVIEAVGPAFWRDLSKEQQAVLTSLAYNYGELPDRVASVIKAGGSTEKISKAIFDLRSDNAGINRKRREEDAKMFGGDIFEDAQNLEEAIQAVKDHTAAELEAAQAAGQISQAFDEVAAAKERARVESELMTKAAKDGIPASEEEAAAIRKVAEAAGQAAGSIKGFTAEQKNNQVWNKAESQALLEKVNADKKLMQQRQQMADQFAQTGTAFAMTFISGLKEGKSATEALTDALANLADQLLQMAISGLFKMLGNAIFGLPIMGPGAASGGMVGSFGVKRPISPFAFVGAPRMAGGGFVGVGPNEFPTILHRGEVVVPAAMVRQAMRLPSGGSGQTQKTTISIGNVSIQSVTESTGDVKADTERGKALGRSIMAMVQSEMTRQTRPGGLLTASGSGGRVGR